MNSNVGMTVVKKGHNKIKSVNHQALYFSQATPTITWIAQQPNMTQLQIFTQNQLYILYLKKYQKIAQNILIDLTIHQILPFLQCAQTPYQYRLTILSRTEWYFFVASTIFKILLCNWSSHVCLQIQHDFGHEKSKSAWKHHQTLQSRIPLSTSAEVLNSFLVWTQLSLIIIAKLNRS